AREDLVGSLREVADPVVLEELVERDRPLAAHGDERRGRAEREERGRGVRRGDPPAARRAGAAPAGAAALLHAETEGLPPLEGRVVVIAASIETQVPAERTHVAKVRRRDREGGLLERRVSRSQRAVADELGERERRPEASRAVDRALAQRRDPAQTHDDAG